MTDERLVLVVSESQTIPPGYHDTRGVTATAEDVREGKEIVDPMGQIVPGGLEEYTGPVEVAPSLEVQILPTSGKIVEADITIQAQTLPEGYHDTRPVTAGAEDVRVGLNIVDAQGDIVPGAIPDYTGPEHVDPSNDEVTLDTQGRYLPGNITIGPSPAKAYFDILRVMQDATIAKSVYTLPDGSRLFSADLYDIGIWLVKDNTAVQVYASGYTWRYVNSIGPDYILMASYYAAVPGLVLIDLRQESGELIYMTGFGYSYSAVFQDRWCLCSSGSVASTLVLVDARQKTVTNLTTSNGWQFLQPMGNRYCLCGSNTYGAGRGLILVDVEEGSSKYLETTGVWSVLSPIGNRWCVCGAGAATPGGILLVDMSTQSAQLVYSTYISVSVFPLGDRYAVCTSANTNTGIVLVDAENASAEKIYATGNNWSFFTPCDDTLGFISSNLNNPGVLMIDAAAKTATTIYPDGYKWEHIKRLTNTQYLLSSSVSAGVGILLVDSATRAARRVYDQGYNWNYFTPVGTQWCVCASSVGGSGVVVYDIAAGTSTLLVTTGAYSAATPVAERWCVCGSTTSSYGLYLLDLQAMTAKKLTTGIWTYLKEIYGRWCVCGGQGTAGIQLVDAQTESIKQVWTVGLTWKFFQAVEGENKCLCGNVGLQTSTTAPTGVALVNCDTNTASQPYANGWGWDTFTPVEGGYLISISNDPYAPTLLYNATTDTITEVTA